MTRILVACMVALWIGTTAFGEELARVRYSSALRVTEIEPPKIDGVVPTSMRFFVRSIAPGVSPDDIRMTLKSKAGDLVISVDANGHFDLPVSKELRDEDPWLIANQPKGSLRMEFAYAFEQDIEPRWVNQAWQVSYQSVFPHVHFRSQLTTAIADMKESLPIDLSYTQCEGAVLSNLNPFAFAKLMVNGVEVEMVELMDGDFVIPFDVEWLEDARVIVSPPYGWTISIDQSNKYLKVQSGMHPMLKSARTNELPAD
ncbi:MAG: hypothetical protein CMM00_06010 [Rhodopirellula sp.]|nr:hypothetical protein [Rhodopirellula sp.]